jgi:Zn-dependent alcohol dehydrogenase
MDNVSPFKCTHRTCAARGLNTWINSKGEHLPMCDYHMDMCAKAYEYRDLTCGSAGRVYRVVPFEDSYAPVDQPGALHALLLIACAVAAGYGLVFLAETIVNIMGAAQW